MPAAALRVAPASSTRLGATAIKGAMTTATPTPAPRLREISMRIANTLTPGLLLRIRGEYLEMPGLRLTLHQATRLFNLDALTCDVALRTLVEDGFLWQTPQGAFLRRDD
jgi:hypothetical protein